MRIAQWTITTRKFTGIILLPALVIGALLWAGRHAPAAEASSVSAAQGFGGYRLAEHPQPLNVRVQDIQAVSRGVQADLCLEMPDLRPWNPYASLTVAGQTIPNSEVRLLNAKDPAVMQSAQRCYRFTFPLAEAQARGGQATLRVEKLWLELGNGIWTPEVVATVKERLQHAAPGVDFEIVHSTQTGGGGAAIRILAKPEALSEEEAAALVSRLAIDELPVSWQMNITLP